MKFPTAPDILHKNNIKTLYFISPIIFVLQFCKISQFECHKNIYPHVLTDF